MQGVSITSHTGAIHYYYSCKNQRKELIEAIVLYLLDDLLHCPALRLIIADECYCHMRQNDNNGAYEASLQSGLKEIESKLANLLTALEAGIFNDTTAERMKELKSEKRILDDALLAEQNRKKFDLKPGTILRWLDSFIGDIHNPDTRRDLLNYLIDKIYVYPDKLATVGFYADDRCNLPFEETTKLIESAKAVRSLAHLQCTPKKVSEMVLRNLPDDQEGGDESLNVEEEDPEFFHVRGSYTPCLGPPTQYYTKPYFYVGGFAVTVWLV